jgi:hypothetical protein
MNRKNDKKESKTSKHKGLRFRVVFYTHKCYEIVAIKYA